MVQEEKGRIEVNRKRCCTFMYLFEFVQLCTFVVVHLCKRCAFGIFVFASFREPVKYDLADFFPLRGGGTMG